eukprot:GILJ01012253.1.p1 GENE.GILJ01012253.1~~GILJ01012253.1.p1  ORF type:complete len:745 (-),score=100.87 GILJ01012253.1:49-1950(-)
MQKIQERQAFILDDIRTTIATHQNSNLSSDNFLRELSKYDLQHKASQATLASQLDNMKSDLDMFRSNLDRKQLAVQACERNVDRLAQDFRSNEDTYKITKEVYETQLGQLGKDVHEIRAATMNRAAGLDEKVHILENMCWQGVKRQAEIEIKNDKVEATHRQFTEQLKQMEAIKATKEDVQVVSKEIAAMTYDFASKNVNWESKFMDMQQAVKEQLGSVATAMATQSGEFITNMRREYEEELRMASNVRKQVMEFFTTVSEKMNSLESQVKSLRVETEEMVQNVQSEIAVVNTRRKKDKASLDISSTSTSEKVSHLSHHVDHISKAMGNVAMVLVGLLEDAQAHLCMDAQEEHDRQSMHLLAYKVGDPAAHAVRAQTSPLSARVPSKSSSPEPIQPVLSVDKRCVSCSGQTATVMQAFKLACLHYTSTPVVYRSKTFTRPELVASRQTLLSSMWQAVKGSSPWKENPQSLQVMELRSGSITPRPLSTAPSSSQTWGSLHQTISPSPTGEDGSERAMSPNSNSTRPSTASGFFRANSRTDEHKKNVTFPSRPTTAQTFSRLPLVKRDFVYSQTSLPRPPSSSGAPTPTPRRLISPAVVNMDTRTMLSNTPEPWHGSVRDAGEQILSLSPRALLT